MEGFAPFCLVCCFVVIQLYHKFERISSFFYLIFSFWRVFDLWITLKVRYTETQEKRGLTKKKSYGIISKH